MDNKTEELQHHGILGQKWGKRNGPPYPLDSGDHSASEKKAGWRKSLSDAVSNHAKKKERQDKADELYDKMLDKIAEKADKRRQKEMGRVIVQSILMGPFGSAMYDQAVAAGRDKGKAFRSALLWGPFGNSAYINKQVNKMVDEKMGGK
jgi:hypothetical protein